MIGKLRTSGGNEMSDQPKHSEVKKEKEERIIDEVRSPVGEFDQKRELGNLEYLLLPRS